MRLLRSPSESRGHFEYECFQQCSNSFYSELWSFRNSFQVPFLISIVIVYVSACVCISRSLDFINVMTYDFHGHWERATGHNSPLFRSSHDSGTHYHFNVVRHTFFFNIYTTFFTRKLVKKLCKYRKYWYRCPPL